MTRDGRHQGPTPDAVTRHGRDLKVVNDKLKELIESLRAQREQLQTRADPSPPPAPPGTEAGVREPEKGLDTDLRLARETLDHRRSEEDRLRDRLAEIESEHRRLCEVYVAVEEQNSDLVALYAALKRLHGTLERRAVLDAIQEIVINMVGCEEFAVYELAPSASELRLARGFGLGAARHVRPDRIPVRSGTLGRVAETGTAWVAGRSAPSDDPDLTAAVPFKVSGRVTGVLAIYRLLGHKPLLRELDRQIFELLETHAASALCLAELHAAKVQAR